MFNCTSCKNFLPESSFQKKTPKKPGQRPVQYWCRTCMAKKRKEWRDSNPDKYRESRLKVTAHNRFKTHGISPAKFVEMVASQKGLCVLCDQLPQGKKGLHASHKVEGLVCHRCHTALAMLSAEMIKEIANRI